MKPLNWTRDNTGRFPSRPYFTEEQLDTECENVVMAFLHQKNGGSEFPISTNDLTVLLESRAENVDFYADLSEEGKDVEAMTLFLPDQPPRVRISHELTENGTKENRFRTTLTHELGHIILHQSLWPIKQPSLFPDFYSHFPRCKRENILPASKVDWMEWQAGYASIAFLMPLSQVRKLVQAFVEQNNVSGRIYELSDIGLTLTQALMKHFGASKAASRIRLLRLGYLSESPVPLPL